MEDRPKSFGEMPNGVWESLALTSGKSLGNFPYPEGGCVAYPMGGHVSARVIPASCCCLIAPIASSTEVLLIALLETKSCHRDRVLQMSAMPPSTPSLIQQLYSPHQSSRVVPGRTLLILLLLSSPLLLQ